MSLVKISATISPELKDMLREFAKEENRTMSDIIEEALHLYRVSHFAKKDKIFLNSKSFNKGNQKIIDQTKEKKYTPEKIKQEQNKDDQQTEKEKKDWNAFSMLWDKIKPKKD